MVEITAPRVEGTVTVGSGRHFGFAEFGPAHGRPIIWMHGTPGARRQIPESARLAAAELGLRIVGIDRPGVGASSAHLHESLLDVAAEIGEVADQLGLDRFAMIGLSGGGPYVLACCHLFPDRIAVGGILGGMAPVQGDERVEGGVINNLSGLAPLVARLRIPLSISLTALLWSLRPVASPAFDLYARLSPEGDRRVFERPEIKAMFLDDLLLGSRTGLAALFYDFVLISRPWGFSLRDIKVPIRWWHGDADNLVPLDHGRHMVSLIPDAQLYVRPGESHLGGLGAAVEVLDTLLAVWDREQGDDGAGAPGR
jgi:pimeloyl-ACP methyl ester carboxylesterase